MPKENKHARGKRGGKPKRKREEAEDGEEPAKRQKSTEAMEDIQFTSAGDGNLESIDIASFQAPESTERPFYGLLDDQEQEYFRHADELLEQNEFEDEEQRQLFLANIYREAEGKELKIANSQSCSRLMERLIQLSTPEQKKRLFVKFGGNFLHLIQHRFASHCCETLFIQSAPVVTAELAGNGVGRRNSAENGDDIVDESMENLFLYTLNELEGHMGFLLTERFASHALRSLLVVLSGKSLEGQTRSLLQSKKKEKIVIQHVQADSADVSMAKRVVPESFRYAVDKIISDTVASMDSSIIRVLATHTSGNPTLQLLLELELTQQGKEKGKQENSVLRKLLPDDLSASDSEGVSFINGLMYDPIGSRLLETIVTFAPGKIFKQIYKICFKERMGNLARNETAGFVITKVLERLSAEDLRDAFTSILPQVPGLVERSRTGIIKTVLERCSARNVDTKELAAILKTCYGEDPAGRIHKMVNFEPSKPGGGKKPKPETKSEVTARYTHQLHGSLLAQAMLNVPGPLAELIQDSLLAQQLDDLQHMATETIPSHIIQVALEPSRSNVPFRRKLVNRLLPLIPSLALHTCGWHTVDALWRGTEGIMNLKERIALSLQEHEIELRNSFEGRKIWRNWTMDLFKRQRREWAIKVKTGSGGLYAAKGITLPVVWGDEREKSEKELKEAQRGRNEKSGKLSIEVARDRYWEEKAKQEKKKEKVETAMDADKRAIEDVKPQLQVEISTGHSL